VLGWDGVGWKKTLIVVLRVKDKCTVLRRVLFVSCRDVDVLFALYGARWACNWFNYLDGCSIVLKVYWGAGLGPRSTMTARGEGRNGMRGMRN